MTRFLARFAAAAAFSLCATSAWALTAPVHYFDFLYNGTPKGTYGGYKGVGHPDFQNDTLVNGLATGLVQSTLSLTGRPVFASSDGSLTRPSLTNAADFSQWYHSVRGVNVAVPGTLAFQKIGANTWQYSNQNFYPLDAAAFNTDGFQSSQGVDGMEHNFSFTMRMHWVSKLTSYSQSIAVTGAEDVWLFVNRHLVIDMGGVHGATAGSITFDAPHLAQIGATLGEPLSFDLFYANRHTAGSVFVMTTSVKPCSRC